MVSFSFFLFPGDTEKKQTQKKEKTQQPTIIEEIVVTGKTPAQQPLSTISLIEKKKMETIAPKNLGDVMNYTSGVYVTEGQKGEAQVKVRGMASQRLTLLYDGIPIYEPYFNSFDLKSFSGSGIENIKIVKGASSVLYGPNALGGVINVVTHRPEKPFLSLTADFSESSTYFISGSGGYNRDNFAVMFNAALDKSDGYKWKQDDNRVLRENSEYDRKNFSGKFYYYPNPGTELMAQVLFYTADYGIPPAVDYYRTRYWKFKDWDRLQLNLGGTFPLFTRGLLKVRTYYVRHYNVLDGYSSADFDSLRWESTYKNDSFGGFILGEYPVSSRNTLHFSINASHSTARQQGDVGDPWEEYQRQVYSLGVEDHFSLSRSWKLVGGLSLDYLKKDSGEDNYRLNPILGIKYSPHQWMDFHLTFSQKSRFPSMRALYSSSSGNPDLLDELGRSIELGMTYHKKIYLSGSVFYNRFDDMIQSYRGLDGYRSYQNVGRAEIYGFEAEIGKKIGMVDVKMNYTYLHTRDMDTDPSIPLDYTPESQLNLFVRIGEYKGFALSIWGIVVSDSIARLGNEPPFELLDIPGYATFHAKLEKRLGFLTLYVKGENLLDKTYFTEPGFPMKNRTFSAGFRLFFGD